jgi:DNA (cytosine-5)-methyltransferase 1
MNHLSLFSGIGGLDLAAEWAGFKTVAFVERDPYCQRVLAKQWPGVPIFDDVRTFKWTGERIDIVSGGFPCQDISRCNPGERAGLAGEHSGLWSEFARIVGEIRPRYIVVENVPELCVRGIERVLGDLADGGYDAEWYGVPAAAAGAPHLRARQWLLAYAAGIGHGVEAEPLSPRWEAAELGPWWATEPGVRRVADGIPGQVDRLRALGNAVVPQVAYPLFAAIARAEGLSRPT